jgi:tripartite-type tricarboxylate transporter receptor subunit TctC
VTPAAVNKDVIARLHRETVKLLSQPEVKERIANVGAEIVGNSPQEFATFIRSERDKYARIIREASIKTE